MDHSHMDHSHMHHGVSGADMPMAPHQCSMNMLFTWDTTNLCIVFRSWHIHNTFTLVISLLAIVALGAGYEALRDFSRRYEARLAQRQQQQQQHRNDGLPRRSAGSAQNGSTKIVQGLLYAAQVYYSFFIMLLFMTYNGWVMLAVAAGAFVGYILFSEGSAAKTVACH